MKHAGTSEAVRFHANTRKAIEVATTAQEDARVAVYNEEVSRKRIDRLETATGLLLLFRDMGFWRRLDWVVRGRVPVLSMPVTESGAETKSVLTSETGASTMAAT